MKNYIRKNIYQWHKIIGLMTIIPVIFWCLSGLMHPFLSNWFKPQIAHSVYPNTALVPEQFRLSVKKVLEMNHISTFKNLRVVQFNHETYYQIKNKDDQWLYFNTQTGNRLEHGEEKYAEHLARYFLADSSSKIKSISLQTEFSQQYKYINRLLPVWKVSFDRSDAMDVYVETPYSRLGTFNPTSRKVFLWVFDNFHNWSFLEKIGNNSLKISIMLLFLGIICISTLSGLVIYGLMWGKFKKPKNQKGVLRKYHRQIGIAVSLVSFTFAFSGAYHATRKITPNILPKMVHEPLLKTHLLPNSLPADIPLSKMNNFSFIQTDSALYYQIFMENTSQKGENIRYFNTKTQKEWLHSNQQYALYLAHQFDQSPSKIFKDKKVISIKDVNNFEGRTYGFAFKRLPVVNIAFDTPDKTNIYIETSSSRLAAKIENADLYEGYSFAIFHKFLFMDWAGKNIRDVFTMLSALGVLIVSLFGLALYLKK